MAQSLEEKWRLSTADNELQTVKEIYRNIFKTNTSPRYFDLETVNRCQTVLHFLTRTIGTVPEEKQKCLEMFDDFISMAGLWWITKSHGSISETDAKYLAVKELTTEMQTGDFSRLTVIALAFTSGAVEVIQRLMLMENVNCVIVKQRKRYDISCMTPTTRDLAICKRSFGNAGISCLEYLSNNPSVRANEILEIEPLKELERIYNSITTRIYSLMAFIHILYMALFSYSVCDILLQRNLNTSSDSNLTSSSSSMEIVFYAVAPVETILIYIYIVYTLYKFWIGRSGFRFTISVENFVKYIWYHVYKIVIPCVYAKFVSSSIITYYDNDTDQYENFSLSLLCGWLLTFYFTRGIRTLHFFLKVIYQIILTDVLKVMFVYLIFFLAFSFAMHVQFLSSPTIIETYKTPMHTMFLMFNVMLGMGDQLVDPDIESGLENAGLAPLCSKLLYIVYVIFVPIVLLNLLIAMMNKSYTRILDQHSLIWRIESILLGIAVETYVPYLVNFCGKGTIHHGKMFDNSPVVSDAHDKKVWYIEVKNPDEDAQHCDDVDGIELDVLEQSGDMQVLTERIQMVEGRLGNIETLLEAINAKLPDINDNK